MANAGSEAVLSGPGLMLRMGTLTGFEKWAKAAWTRETLEELERLVSRLECSLSSIAFQAHFALKQDQMRTDLANLHRAIFAMGGVGAFPHVYSMAHVNDVRPHYAYGMPPRQPYQWPWQAGQAGPQPSWTYTPHIPHPAFYLPQEHHSPYLGTSDSVEWPRHP